MDKTIISALAIYGLAFLLKESDGPFDLILNGRTYLLQNKYVGVFFYKLLSCYFCVGTYSGAIVYSIMTPIDNWNIYEVIIWFLAGGAISLLLHNLNSKDT
jgi:hypothetical protein